eukprot:jgi/Psemu1/320570/estExt_fgenesh1_pm.C_6310003
MDLSIVATVGSFAFSERVLKPKATVLVILGIVLAYDLATKTQDTSSIRVYRGPILLVFTLMMVAYSLRTWRRNGVACDEFIFLPGTRHGHHVGIEAPLIEALSGDDDSDSDENDFEFDCSLPGDTESPSSGPTPSETSAGGIRSRLRRCVERHPHLAQLWTFFFNRSAGSGNANATYAPSGPAVFGAALDLSMPVLFNFHVFIVTFNHIQKPNYIGSELPVNILPIGFLAVLYARTVIPPSRRARFWGTMKFALSAPLHRVGVRDEFIGDCLTSWVRPGQDLIFATIYFFAIIWGTVSGRYGLTKTGEMLAESWWVHNVLLPCAGMVPLWLKYLQTLRRAYDDDRRWPHLGNAVKYLSAALVVVYGTTHPEKRRSLTWIACFVAAAIYQVVWDVVVDWQLFEIQRDISVVIAGSTASGDSSTISSFRPDSRILLGLHMYLLQPVRDKYQLLRARIPGWRSIQLRQRRLYKTESFYWKIFAFNAVTRFAWMYCFLPAYHFSQTNNESASSSASPTIVLTSTSEVQSFWGVLLPACEIFRRTLWGFLYMEHQTIRMMDADVKYQRVGHGYGDDDDDEFDLESEDRTINSKLDENRNSFRNKLLPTWLGNQQQVAHNAATARAKEQKKLLRKLFVVELCVWSAAFVVLCGVVAVA